MNFTLINPDSPRGRAHPPNLWPHAEKIEFLIPNLPQKGTSTLQKAANCVSCLFILPPLFRFAGTLIARYSICYVAPQKYRDECRAKFEQYLTPLRLSMSSLKPYRYTISTGSSSIDAVLFKNSLASPDQTPTILIFQANGASYQACEFSWFIDAAESRGLSLHLALFDYPGVGDSADTARTENELVKAGLAMIRLIQMKLGTPKELIYCYGRSLGGCVALRVIEEAKLTGPRIIDRAPNSILDVIRSYAGPCGAWLAEKPIQHREFKAGEALRKVAHQGPTWILHHPEDRVIRTSASLSKTAQELGIPTGFVAQFLPPAGSGLMAA